MAKLLRTKMIQYSYTVGLCKNSHKEAQFRTKGFGADYLWLCVVQISHVQLFLGPPTGAVEPLADGCGTPVENHCSVASFH